MGRTLNARIGFSSLAPNEFLEVVQGEQKTITFIVEANIFFENASATTVTVKLKDPAGTLITIDNSDIERAAELIDVQVIRVTLTEEQTESLIEGLLFIEISFDKQKAVLTHALKIIKGL